MSELAIFTEEIATELIAMGFVLVAKTKKAWHFEDSMWIRIAVEELLERYVDNE